MKKYYVYVCKVDGVVKYVGKGSGSRYKHCTSGKSTCLELNRDFFNGCNIEVEKLFSTDNEDAAYAEETRLIAYYPNLYNKNVGKVKVFGQVELTNLLLDTPAYKLGWTEAVRMLAIQLSRFAEMKDGKMCATKGGQELAELIGIKQESLRKRYSLLKNHVKVIRKGGHPNVYEFNIDSIVAAHESATAPQETTRGNVSNFQIKEKQND